MRVGARLTDGPEERPDVVHEFARGLHGGEMAAAARAGPADHVVGRLRPGSRCEADLAWEDRHSGGRLPPGLGHGAAASLLHPPVHAKRRRGCACYPVGGDVVEEAVKGECVAEVAVAPLLEYLDDPPGQAGGRILEPVPEGLRLGALYLLVPDSGPAPDP